MPMSRISSSSIAFLRIRSLRLVPSSFSMTMNGCPFMSSMSWMVQMPGWFSCDAARASRTKRSSDFRSCSMFSGINFRATWRPRRVSSASYTTPIPPPPSFPTMLQWETVWPIIRRASDLSGRYVRPTTEARSTTGRSQVLGDRSQEDLGKLIVFYFPPRERATVVNRGTILFLRPNTWHLLLGSCPPGSHLSYSRDVEAAPFPSHHSTAMKSSAMKLPNVALFSLLTCTLAVAQPCPKVNTTTQTPATMRAIVKSVNCLVQSGTAPTPVSPRTADVRFAEARTGTQVDTLPIVGPQHTHTYPGFVLAILSM